MRVFKLAPESYLVAARAQILVLGSLSLPFRADGKENPENSTACRREIFTCPIKQLSALVSRRIATLLCVRRKPPFRRCLEYLLPVTNTDWKAFAGNTDGNDVRTEGRSRFALAFHDSPWSQCSLSFV